MGYSGLYSVGMVVMHAGSIRRGDLKILHVTILLMFASGGHGSEANPVVLDAVSVTASSFGQPLDLEQKNQTASRLGLSLRETPASVFVVDRETMERRGVDNTQEALKSVPGITARRHQVLPVPCFIAGSPVRV